MNVIFHHPPANRSTNPFREFKPNEPTHYPKGTGVYIYGLRLNIVEDAKKTVTQHYEKNNVPFDEPENWKFVPLYVGITHALSGKRSLLQRLYFEHYLEERTNGSSVKEMFDFSLGEFNNLELSERYSDIKEYDKLKKNGKKVDNVKDIKHLIWFQNLNFYLKRFFLGSNEISKLKMKWDSNHFETIRKGGIFETIFIPRFAEISGKIVLVKKQMEATKARFKDHFYFVYAEYKDEFGKLNENDMNGHGRISSSTEDADFLNGIEHAVKEALKSININTSADSNAKDTITETIQIDLSNIQDKLVNVNGISLPLKLSYTPPPPPKSKK